MNEPVYRVETIRKKPGRRDRFLITFAPERDSLELSGVVLARARLAPRDRIAEEKITALVEEEKSHQCLERAWGLLGRRKRGRKELAQALRKRGFPAAMIETVVARLEAMGYVDDREFTRFWVMDRMERGRHGPERVRRELLAKGVERQIIDEALAPYRDSNEQRTRADALLEKWLRTARASDPRRRRAAAVAYLLRRGFEPDLAHRCVREAFAKEDAEE